MTQHALGALLAQADAGGVDFEGLVAERVDGDPGSEATGSSGTEVGATQPYHFEAGGSSYGTLTREELRAAARQHREHLLEWHFWRQVVPADPPRYAFLRWLEDADDHAPTARREVLVGGVTATWGQLRVTVTPVEGGRRAYEVRHVADADERVEELAVHTDPGDMLEVRRTAADGSYRPLSTAPTLRPGWVFVDLDPVEVVETVEHCYPATVANWHREREGDLDVTHWREAAERQTGIYDLVDELEGDAVAALAGACCVDSRCLKRRVWDEEDDADDNLDVSSGEGVFPCREPCSLVVAAAREFVRDEREDAEAVPLELEPRERAQLRRLLDAAADGEVADIAVGDLPDPANPLRLRYLRERLRDRDSPLVHDDEQQPSTDGE